MEYATVRSEITGTVLDYTTGKENFRIISCTDAYPRIGLGVFKKDIVSRLELLDEIVFQKQGICFSFNYSIFRISYFRDHHSSLACKPLCRNKILSYPLVQVLGLAHINDIPLGVIIPVDTGGMREKLYFISYIQYTI